MSLGNDLLDRLKLNLLFEFFFVVFSNSGLSLAGFSSRLSCFGFGLGHGSDNEPLFGQTLNPCQVGRPERVWLLIMPLNVVMWALERRIRSDYSEPGSSFDMLARYFSSSSAIWSALGGATCGFPIGERDGPVPEL